MVFGVPHIDPCRLWIGGRPSQFFTHLSFCCVVVPGKLAARTGRTPPVAGDRDGNAIFEVNDDTCCSDSLTRLVLSCENGFAYEARPILPHSPKNKIDAGPCNRVLPSTEPPNDGARNCNQHDERNCLSVHRDYEDPNAETQQDHWNHKRCDHSELRGRNADYTSSEIRRGNFGPRQNDLMVNIAYESKSGAISDCRLGRIRRLYVMRRNSTNDRPLYRCHNDSIFQRNYGHGVRRHCMARRLKQTAFTRMFAC